MRPRRAVSRWGGAIVTAYLKVVLAHSKTRGSVRVLMAAVAFYHDQYSGWPKRHHLPAMVNETRRQCDKLIDYAVLDGELLVTSSGEYETGDFDEIKLNLHGHLGGVL